jgi:hypothetical protein
MSFTGKVLWGAVMKGLNAAIALGSFLYMIRMSVHGTASKKNIPNLARTVKIDDSSVASPTRTSISRPPPTKARTFSEVVDMEAVMQQIPTGTTKSTTKVIRAKPTNSTLKKIWIQYGDSQSVPIRHGRRFCVRSIRRSSTNNVYGSCNPIFSNRSSWTLLYLTLLFSLSLDQLGAESVSAPS